MVSKIDILLENVGALGRYQWQQLVLCALGPTTSALHALGPTTSALHFMAIVFHSLTPNHR